jgi:DNA (cytosine-5)-methyltransferase 1
VAKSVISLFAGAGGLDCGLKAAGFETVVSLDMDAACASALRVNRVGNVLEQDVSSVRAEALIKSAGVREVDILTAGPPCQPFSKSANWRYGSPLGLHDPRSETLYGLLRLVAGVLPRVVLIENVPGFGARGTRGGIDAIQAGVQRLNRRHGTKYRISSAVLDAADFGVPQHRRRLIMVLDRDGRQFSMPAATHGEAKARPFTTAWDAIGELQSMQDDATLAVRGRWADLLPSIPEGENYLWHTERGGGVPLFGWRTRYWSFLLKLAKDRPSWTLPASPSQNSGPYHWKNRLLSIRELARLQNFPDSWQFSGSRSQQVRQIGNAVPPLLAEVLGLEIRRQLLGERLRGRAPKLLLKQCETFPPPERRRRIAKKYEALIGDHKPHPGHGRGPGARTRRIRGLPNSL